MCIPELNLFIYLALPTRAGSPQQHMPITVGPFCLTHPVNFPCGRKPEYPEETHDFRQSVDFYSSHGDWVRVALRKFSLRLEPAASEVKGKCANHLATEAPWPPKPEVTGAKSSKDNREIRFYFHYCYRMQLPVIGSSSGSEI